MLLLLHVTDKTKFIWGGMTMQTTVKYQSDTKNVTLGGKMITVENLTPVFPLNEREQRKSEIEKKLFNVFVKYTDKHA